MSGILVTGATGFVGSHLIERAIRAGELPWALARRPRTTDGVRWLQADLTDPRAVVAAIERAEPERIYHLGAMAAPAACAADPERAEATNVGGTAAVLDGAEATGARVLLVSSAQVYGRVAGTIAEDQALDPVTVYGKTKRDAEALARDRAERGHHVVIARPFNHSGPGQTTAYVLPALVEQVRAAAEGRRPVLTGNLFPRRDFLHVDDVLDAYGVLLDRGRSGEAYNVCRGEGLAIGTALAGIQARLGLADQRTEEDPERIRPDDPEEIVGDPAKLKALGWSPKVDVESLLDAIATPAL